MSLLDKIAPKVPAEQAGCADCNETECPSQKYASCEKRLQGLAVPPTKFKVGDVVKHKGAFLRSIQWYLNVPKDGRIEDVSCLAGTPTVYTVVWSDGHVNRIAESNIQLAGTPDYS